MNVRVAVVSSCLLALAGTAMGQSQRQVYTQDNFDFGGFGAVPTAPDVAVSGLATVVCWNTYLALYPKTTTLPAPPPHDRRTLLVPPLGWPVPQSPFELSIPSQFQDRFIDPRATYDTPNDRLWVAYLETSSTEAEADCSDISKLHISISKDPADFGGGPLNTLADTHWWYYTGPTDRSTPPTTGSFDLTFVNLPAEQYARYKNETSSNFPFEDAARMATIAVDGTKASGRGAAFLTPNRFEYKCDSAGGDSPVPPDLLEPTILIIPLNHGVGGADSILDGDRPDETEIVLLNLWSTPGPLETDRLPDLAEAPYLVQEPYEEYDNAVFLVSGIGERFSTGREDTIRLRGFFYDDTEPAGQEWTLQQRVDTGAVNLEDMPIPDMGQPVSPFAFHPTPPISMAPRPRTPHTTAPFWGPAAEGYIFHSAVLTEDTSGNPRIFAVHTVFPDDDGTAVNKWVVQWYVIDPDLANFRDTPAPADTWDPQVVAVGRLSDAQDDQGDRYHPVIVVNRQGQAFIEYTYSDESDPMNDDTWPEIRRVRLNNSYTGIVGPETVVRSGPPLPFVEGALPGGANVLSWANYAGAQADPTNGCAYWSTHTLVDDPGAPLPTNNDEREVVLFHQAYSNSTGPNCFQTPNMLDLNDDNEVDSFDMMEFGPMFDRRARRVDVDGNGVVDATDMTLFIDAYDGYTSRR